MLLNKEPSESLCLFYTTFPSEKTTKEVISYLLEQKLLACANFFPITSMYIWEGEKEEGMEIGCYLKTVASKKELFRQYFLEKHPYDVPCLIEFTIEEVHKPYLSWAKEIIL